MTANEPGSTRDPLRERLDGLRRLSDDTHKPTEEMIRENLTNWLADAGHGGADIRIRRGFLVRVPPPTKKEIAAAGAITDYRRSGLVRVPPLAVLTALSRGIGLRCALTLPFLAQTNRPAMLGSHGLVKLPIDADDAQSMLGLMAVPATYLEGGVWGGGVRANRGRQIRAALRRLAGDDLKMIVLPSGGQGIPRFNEVHLRNEIGASASDPLPYTTPTPSVTTVDVPTAFFTNGWIHALTNREIAAWLMLRDLTTQAALVGANPALDGVKADSWDRLTLYGLGKRTLDTSRELEAFGLVEVIRDEENRRPNGTTRAGVRAAPNRYRLRDAGLDELAVATVVTQLKARPNAT